jgi:hypothetical protein
MSPKKKKKPLTRSEAAFVLAGQRKTLERIAHEVCSTNVEFNYLHNATRNIGNLIKRLKEGA